MIKSIQLGKPSASSAPPRRWPCFGPFRCFRAVSVRQRDGPDIQRPGGVKSVPSVRWASPGCGKGLGLRRLWDENLS